MERIHPEVVQRAQSVVWTFRAPLLLAAALVCVLTGLSLARLTLAQSPRDPGEATEVIEAWRHLHGLPVYELPPNGHATHFYGALVPHVQGEIFRWVGPNNLSGRILSLVSAIATITLIAAFTRTRGASWLAIVAWAALLGTNHRTGQYFIENRPDMTALFFTTAALGFMGLGLEKKRGSLMAMGAACIVVGFFFKQTASIFAAVPLVVLASRGRRPAREEILLAIAPLAAMFGSMLVLRLFCPAVYHYMIEVPGSYRVDRVRAAKSLWRMMLQSPLFLILVAEWLAVDGGSVRKNVRLRWVVATLALAVPFSAAAYGKFGGVLNSLLPALLAMMAFCALRLPVALARVESLVTSLAPRVAIGSFAATLLLMTVFPSSSVLENRLPFDGRYDDVIATVAKLPGMVVCPKDPTIPMYAKDYAGRGLVTELDAYPTHGTWADSIPPTVIQEVCRADFLVDIRDYFDDRMGDEDLRHLGFEPADELMPDASSYRLWRRKGNSNGSGARTAWNAPLEQPTRDHSSTE